MKVKDLLTLLSQMPAEADVVVRGYEGGVDDVVNVKMVKSTMTYMLNGIMAGMRLMETVIFKQCLFRGENVNPIKQKTNARG